MWALQRRRLLFPVRPKQHQYEHLPLDSITGSNVYTKIHMAHEVPRSRSPSGERAILPMLSR